METHFSPTLLNIQSMTALITAMKPGVDKKDNLEVTLTCLAFPQNQTVEVWEDLLNRLTTEPPPFEDDDDDYDYEPPKVTNDDMVQILRMVPYKRAFDDHGVTISVEANQIVKLSGVRLWNFTMNPSTKIQGLQFQMNANCTSKDLGNIGEVFARQMVQLEIKAFQDGLFENEPHNDQAASAG